MDGAAVSSSIPLSFTWPEELAFTAAAQHTIVAPTSFIPLEPGEPPPCPGRGCLLNGQRHEHARIAAERGEEL